jgi:hypothetical protein
MGGASVIIGQQMSHIRFALRGEYGVPRGAAQDSPGQGLKEGKTSTCQAAGNGLV